MVGGMARLEVCDGIAIVSLDKPPVNAFDLGLVRDTEECLRKAVDERDARAVLITGKGRCFSAGLDLKTVPYYTPTQQRQLVEDLNRAVAWLYGLSLPTIAAVNGHAIAGGFILAIACDYRVGTSAACSLGVTESRVGIPFPASTMEVLRSELEPAVARRMALTGRLMGPEEALANGVLDELCPADRVLARAKEMAMELGALPRGAYAKIKLQLRGETLARMDHAVRTRSDPLLKMWIAEEGQTFSAAHLQEDA